MRRFGSRSVALLVGVLASVAVLAACSGAGAPARTEAFEFSSNGVATRGRVHLPESFEPGMELPTIYLIDFTEEHTGVALDEFETVIDSVNQIDGLNALVATLEGIPDIQAHPGAYQEYAGLFRDMANHIDANYTNSPSRTFMGRASEAGIVLLELFGEDPDDGVFDNYLATDPPERFTAAVVSILETEDFSQAATSKKLHLSFSDGNNVYALTQLADLIDQADYPWLEYESVYYPDSYFTDTYQTAFADGLRFAFGG
jgi:hypothetical protein